VYVESLSRIEGPSLTYRLIAPIAARLYVQWPELAEKLPRSRFSGNVFSAET
jgi:beta-1,4-N-acetylglucosaminyltransferase